VKYLNNLEGCSKEKFPFLLAFDTTLTFRSAERKAVKEKKE